MVLNGDGRAARAGQRLGARCAGRVRLLALALVLCGAGPALAQSPPPPKPAATATANAKFLAPGFAGLTANDLVLLMPADVELFSLSAGGVAEPRADWTADAQRFMNQAVTARIGQLGLRTLALGERDADEFAEQVGLHAAVARSIDLHHGVGGIWALPTKDGQLRWSFDDAMQPLRQHGQARYALFVWVRDSYASAERKAAMVALALLGVGITGGAQVAYASLVDLSTGQVVWFNRLARASGDLREAEPARETIEVLLTGLPAAK